MSTNTNALEQHVNIHTPLTADDVRAFRKAHQLTQAALSVKLDVSKRAIEVWESAEGPRAPFWVRLAFAAIQEGLPPWPEKREDRVPIQVLEVDAEPRPQKAEGRRVASTSGLSVQVGPTTSEPGSRLKKGKAK